MVWRFSLWSNPLDRNRYRYIIDGEEKYDEDEEPRSTGSTGTYGNFAFAKFISAVGWGLVFCYGPRWINLKLVYCIRAVRLWCYCIRAVRLGLNSFRFSSNPTIRAWSLYVFFEDYFMAFGRKFTTCLIQWIRRNWQSEFGEPWFSAVCDADSGAFEATWGRLQENGYRERRWESSLRISIDFAVLFLRFYAIP